MAIKAMGLNFLNNLTGVSLTQPCGFRFIATHNNLTRCRINREHGNSIMSTAYNFAQVTTLTARLNDNGLSGLFIQHDTVRFRTIHDAQSATLFSDTFIVIYPRYVIHLENLLIFE